MLLVGIPDFGHNFWRNMKDIRRHRSEQIEPIDTQQIDDYAGVGRNIHG
jgi:hypothetical protein